MTQIGRNLTDAVDGILKGKRYLIHDRDPLHHLTQAAHDTALRHLCDQLNATETVFPETDLRLIYRVGASSEIPRDQEI